ncbi:hypothetical protein BDV23DRAFT_72240 [Aspergillus alliaceus]|uniref:Uncharacterized protein n=1 Tax=Petromyces alliaceus TaxID=209559 RepID=A0A5N7CB72_PETAA|nr:uncharacterized protein BDW43DRAFT_135703 [Aspergillus alliaceus]KAB8231634.1 hypothetical protein BDW43DRAFT_135703 [Aspergillus alliaceus]KAE8391179.1 hypothetical protein BDV23DRAFT_72240 [Aspergillus alliaceus]
MSASEFSCWAGARIYKMTEPQYRPTSEECRSRSICLLWLTLSLPQVVMYSAEIEHEADAGGLTKANKKGEWGLNRPHSTARGRDPRLTRMIYNLISRRVWGKAWS